MSLENTAQILYTACRAGYCVGAFNIVDYLSLEAAITAAETNHAPVIIQTSGAIVRRYGAKRLVAMTRTLAENSFVPIGLHLDHGTEYELIKDCIESGYTSVMIDASLYPFEENITRTRQIVDLAHAHGVSVEGEIGVLAGVEDDLVVQENKAAYTTPEEAIEFQSRTEVDFLAIAIGTAHGFYAKKPSLDVEILRIIHKQVDFPLVIHGGSGLSMEVIHTLVSNGAAKFNLSTQIKKDYIESLVTYLDAHADEYNPLRMMDHTQQQLVNTIGKYMQVLGSAERY